jgi:hypothetical protein
MSRSIKSFDPIEHFMSKVTIVDGHWLWKHGFNDPNNGYGIYYTGVVKSGKRIYELAHRHSWKLFVGPIPEDTWILHKEECNIRQCVNWEHLRPGSPKQNSEDCFKFGGRGRSRLTDIDILDIRASNLPRIELATKYDLCYHSIMRIQQRKTFKVV